MPTRTRASIALRAVMVAAGAVPLAGFFGGSVEETLRRVFASYCHQRPERTLVLLGHTMVVCSRCFGLYLGVVVGAIVPMPRPLVPRARVLLGAALAAAVIDVVTQDLGLHPPFHPVRLATGFLVGLTAAGWMSAALVEA